MALTVMGIEFDCLAGRDCKDDPLEVWAVDVSGYWMRALEMGSIAAQLDKALEAQQRLIDAERRQTYGDLTDKEIAELEHNSVLQREENRALEEDRRKEQAKKQEEYARERALRERKNYADQVSNELRMQEAMDKQKANWERQLQEAQARREQAEEDARIQQRLAREREQWRRELQR